MKWYRKVRWVLHAALLAAIVYVAVVFIQRARQSGVSKDKPAPLPLSPDYYVVLPKSYVRDLKDARTLIGKPLWIRDGYRWSCTPRPGVLGPVEKVVPRRVFKRNDQVWLEFEKDGRPCAIAISSGDLFYVDEIFFIKDPHEIYKEWTPETWQKIAERRIESGMTETQITFVLGYGRHNREMSQPGDAHRVMEYTGSAKHMRVTYHHGVAKQVEPLPEKP